MARKLPGSLHLRAKRWDVVVLGSALPGLVAAVRLAMAGLRVLLVEEEVAARSTGRLRDPFFLPTGPVLQHCLGALGVRAMDQRLVAQDASSYQVVLPEARVEINGQALTAEDLATWRLAEPDAATALLRELFEAARSEGEALLNPGLLRASEAPVSREATGAPGAGQRGLPRAVQNARGGLARFFEAQWRACASGAGERPTSEACARLLGSALSGGLRFIEAGSSLRQLLMQRLEALHGEVRAHEGAFEFTEKGAPGIVLGGPRESICLGRALVLNAPAERLRAACEASGHGVPPFLEAARTPAPARRVALQLQAPHKTLPEPLAPRALWWPDRGDVPNPVEIARHPSTRGGEFEELVLASTFVAGDTPDKELVARLLEAAGEILPLDGATRSAELHERPLWDDDASRCDPGRGEGWPNPVEIRADNRRGFFYHLPRSAVAGLGAEGELLLGITASDAIRQKLR